MSILYITAKMNQDQCTGAALILCFLSDIFTISGKDQFSKTDVLAILDLIGKRELPEGLVDLVKGLADDMNGEQP